MEPLYVFDGHQYPADRLPAGVSVDGLPTVEEWFAANRRPAEKVPPKVDKPGPKPKADRSK